MALWIANPLNLLATDDTLQLPLMNGWWNRNTSGSMTSSLATWSYLQDTLLPSDILLPNDGPLAVWGHGMPLNDNLLLGDNVLLIDSDTPRPGNGNGTITVEGGSGLSSHRVVTANVFPDGYAVTAGTELTFAISSIGTINNATSSVCRVDIIWVNSSNAEIGRSFKSRRCPFGKKLRIATTSVAPTGTVRCVLQITANQACIVSHATLLLGDKILANNDINYLQENNLFLPSIGGDRWLPNTTNLMPVDGHNGGTASMYQWRDIVTQIIAPANNVLTIPALTTYSLNFKENLGTTTNQGIDILPGTAYIFSIAETGTSPTISLNFYDITGTVLISSITMPAPVDGRRVASFVTPANAASVVISATGGSSSAALSLPTLIQGSPTPAISLRTSLTNQTSLTHRTGNTNGDPGSLPPIFVGTVTLSLDAIWANRQLARKTLDVSCSNLKLKSFAIDALWSNRTVVRKTLDVLYDESTPTRINFDVAYANHTLAGRNLSVSYPIHQTVAKILDVVWNDLGIVSTQQLDVVFANQALAGTILDVSSAINALVSKTLVSMSSNNALARKTSDIVWNNRQTATMTPFVVAYSLNAQIHQNLDVQYDLHTLARKDIQFIWGINSKPRVMTPRPTQFALV